MSKPDCQGFFRPKVVVIQGESISPAIHQLREALLECLIELPNRVEFLPVFSMGELENDPEPRVVVASSLETMKKLSKLEVSEANQRFILLAQAFSFPNAGPRFTSWADQLRQVVDNNTTVFTNGDLSRHIIDEVLHGFRADVKALTVKQQKWDDNQVESEHWNFDAALVGGTSQKFSYSGEKWGEGWPKARNESVVEDKDTDWRAVNLSVVKESITSEYADLSGMKVGIVGTKLTFIDELARDLSAYTGSDVKLDPWKYLSGPPNSRRTFELLDDSDVVIGEWARPNNFWMQERAPSDTRLIVRAHRYEVTTDFPHKIDMSRFDAGVVIVPWVGRKLVQDFGWPKEKMVFIPNYVKTNYFDRKKLPGAEFTLGIVGITPSLKRLDLALDLLSELREYDSRFNLRVRGDLPTTHVNWEKDPTIEEQWSLIQYRLLYEERLRGAVHFDTSGRDMGSWYRQVGVILSLSDIEGSHVALAEGIASGALPVVRPWPGAETLWPPEMIFGSGKDAVDWVLKSLDASWKEAKIAEFQALRSLQDRMVIQAWSSLLSGKVEEAQAVFGPIDWEADMFTPLSEYQLWGEQT